MCVSVWTVWVSMIMCWNLYKTESWYCSYVGDDDDNVERYRFGSCLQL